MPVTIHNYSHFNQQVPGPPLAVTSITKDAGATVSFRAPASSGGGAITSYTVTPYIAGSAQSATTVPVASLTQITGSDSSTYQQAAVTGLTNSTAYTFTVHASNSYGAGTESAPSGANTPLAGLVFGDDFGGPAGGAVDPEWWVYTRCGYLAQSEVEYYLPDHCQLDGAGNLALTAEHLSYTGPGYPSAGGGSVTQPWRSGACQSNVRNYQPAAGNTMTFEVRQQLCADAGSGFWPGLFWLEGQDYQSAWKTDPQQSAWDNAGKAEIDVAEWYMSGSPDTYGTNVWGNSNQNQSASGSGLSSSPHVFQARWKPGVSVSFWRDGSQTGSTVTASGIVPSTSTRFFLLLYLQMLSGGSTATESCLIDYVRVYDQNLG